MNRHLHLAGIVVCISILVSCNSAISKAVDRKQAVLQEVTAGGEDVQDFQIHGTRPLGQKEIVLYSFVTEQQLPRFGYALVRHQGITWKVEQSRGFGGRPAPPLVSYDQDQTSDALLIFGQVLREDVQAVEISFDTGRTIRDEAADHVFAVLEAGATSLRKLCVLSSDDTALACYTQPRLTTS